MAESAPRYLVGASTKAYMGHGATVTWAKGIASAIDERPGGLPAGVTAFFIPAFPLLPAALELLAPRGVVVGAQSVSWGQGALTGEVSAPLLAEMGVRIVEIGHAERREHFGETSAVIAQKVRVSLDVGLTPLLCIGELERGSAPQAAEFCKQQVREALRGQWADLGSLVLAYEPVWAIGAADPAPASFVSEVVALLRSALVAELPDAEDGLPAIIYGGSAGPGLLPTLSGVDGLFLGRYAHDPANFMVVVDEAAAAITAAESRDN